MNMKNRNYSVIVFDLGNVLLPFHHDFWIKKYNAIYSGLGDNYYKKYLENYIVHREYEAGKISDDEFIAANLIWLENKVSSEKFCEIYSKIFTINKNVIELLPILKEKYKLVLLSNTSSIHKKYGWEENSFLNYFDKLILSYEVGAVKPEEKIYKAVEKFTKEAPEKHIFIDDILDYANAAKKLGWDGIHFIGYEIDSDRYE